MEGNWEEAHRDFQEAGNFLCFDLGGGCIAVVTSDNS